MSATDRNLSTRKRSRSARAAGEADPDDTPSRCSSDGTGFPAAIARVLVENGFLGAHDLGLRIGALNRSLRETSLDDDLWSCVCRRRYPNTAAVPPALIERRGGYRGWYRMRQAFIDGPPQPPDMQEALPPPATKREDYMLLVDLFYCDKSVLSRVVKGDDLGPFLEEGRVRLGLDEPFTLGTSLPSWPPPEAERTDADIDYEQEDLCYSLESYRLETVDYDVDEKFEALVHLVRISDGGKECCVMNEADYVACEDDDAYHVRHYEDTTSTNELEFTEPKRLRLKATANYLLERIVGSRVEGTQYD